MELVSADEPQYCPIIEDISLDYSMLYDVVEQIENQ